MLLNLEVNPEFLSWFFLAQVYWLLTVRVFNVSLEMSRYKRFSSALLSSSDEVELPARNPVVTVQEAIKALRPHAI